MTDMRVKKLPEGEDQTATLAFEKASRNVIQVKFGHCSHCLEPTGVIGVKVSIVKVWTTEGIKYWCEKCVREGLEKKTCIKYRSMSKKERKKIRKLLKKQNK